MQSFEDLALSMLLGISSLFGVTAIPESVDPSWKLVYAWKSENGFQTLRAKTSALVSECREKPNHHIEFPSVIHAAHTLKLDGREVKRFGDPSFKKMRSFYGTISISCREIQAGSELEWNAYSYTRYFARIPFYPRLVPNEPKGNVFFEHLNIIAAAAAMLLMVFCFLIFYGKESNRLTYAITASNLGWAGYFAGSVASFFGADMSAMEAHRWADIFLWIGFLGLAATLRYEKLISETFYRVYFGIVVVAWGVLLTSQSGEIIQFGISLPFFPSLIMLSIALRNLCKALKVDKKPIGKMERRALLQIASLSFFVLSAFNDIFVVVGLANGIVFGSLGVICALFFLALSVNERMIATYKERDHLRAHLEEEVINKTAELRTKTEQLETAMGELKSTQAELVQAEKLASLGTLSAGIAHEINNSINYVNGALVPLERIVMKSETEGQSKAQKLFGVMKEGLHLTMNIIKSLRNYSGLNQAEYQDVSIKEMMDTVLNLLNSRIRGQAEVHVEVPDGAKVFGNSVGLNQIFMNLLANSLDAMDGNGQIWIQAFDEGEKIRIKFRDSGKGIPKEILDKIFDPFFTTKDVGKGTGLGLHIVRTEVERHRGAIQVESSPEGTTFDIELPKEAKEISSPGMAA